MHPRHEIETTLAMDGPHVATFYLPHLRNLMKAIEADGRGSLKVTTCSCGNVRVVVNGSGILLHDTLVTLERTGFL